MSEEKKSWWQSFLDALSGKNATPEGLAGIGPPLKYYEGATPEVNNPSSASGGEVDIPASSVEASTDACENEPISSTFFEEPIHVVVSNKTEHSALTKTTPDPSDDQNSGVNKEMNRLFDHLATNPNTDLSVPRAAAQTAATSTNTSVADAATKALELETLAGASVQAEDALSNAITAADTERDSATGLTSTTTSALENARTAADAARTALNEAQTAAQAAVDTAKASEGLSQEDQDAIGAAENFINASLANPDAKTQKNTFKDHLYDFTGNNAEMFASFVFAGSKTRCFTENHSTTETIGGTPYVVQKNNGDKIEALEIMIETAVKLCFMISREDPITAYASEYTNASEEAKQTIREQCNYGLWGKFYTKTDGWHRGIDMVPGGSVYALCGGEIVGKRNYYLSIYNETEDVTFTYMHLRQTHEKEIGDSVTAGDELGTQSNVNTVGPHTHVEVNEGRYISEFGRPESTDLGGWSDIYITDVNVGDRFSLNPYRYIENVFSARENAAATTSSNAESSIPIDPENIDHFQSRIQ